MPSAADELIEAFLLDEGAREQQDEMEEGEQSSIDNLEGSIRTIDALALRRAKPKEVAKLKGLLDGGAHNVGQVITIVDDGSDVGKTVLELKADDEKAEMLTIAFFGPPSLLAVVGALPIFEVIVIVDFGSGGVSQTAELDYIRGQTFQVPGSFVRVSAKCKHVTGAMNSQVQVGAMASKDTYPRTSRLCRSFNVPIVVEQGVSAAVAIPPFATEVQFVPNDADESLGSIGIVRLADRAGNTRYKELFNSLTGQLPIIPISGAVDFVTVFNNGAALSGRTFTGRLVFTIEI